jgi:hypothetical protein
MLGRPRSWIVGLLALGCGPDVSGTVDAWSTGGADEGGCEPVDDTTRSGIGLTINHDVDILFVIDNSATMAEEQAALARGIGTLIERLEHPDVRASYRIAFTTTDNGNPWCTDTTPEAGALRASSCAGRLDEFMVDGTEPLDATAPACLDLCAHEDIALLPTTTSIDAAPRSRPWLESTDGVTNVPPSISMTEAAQCMIPQGIDGCGFEQPLAGIELALARTEDDADPAWGFLRPNAILAVVVVSDETDCSVHPWWSEIFLPVEQGGNEVFWSDPSASTPTSAVCWNAGVSCTIGSMLGVYDECHAMNRDFDGFEIEDADDAEMEAVLQPVAHFVDMLQTYEDEKQQITPGQELIFAAISGVPEGYEPGVVDIPWADAADPLIQLDLGIGPGCEGPGGSAVPPVREREVAEELEVAGRVNVHSVCAADYAPALSAIADEIAAQIKPACMPACVADADPTTPGLQPDCVITQVAPTHEGTVEEIDVPPCTDANGTLPFDANVCWVPRSGGTIHPYCGDLGYNLEFEFYRRAGFPAPGGTAISPCCAFSQNRAIDCPGLP